MEVNMSEKNPLTTDAGIPVGDNQNALSAGPRGPLLVQDWQLFERHAHFNRERIPERVVHAKGSGAYGTLTITNDITRYSKAKVFSAVGKDHRPRPREPSARSVRRHRARRLSKVAALRPNHARAGRRADALQPLRSDQGVAAQGLPAHRGRHPGAQPQPGEL